MKVKVIDLLNVISEGEKIPKKIKYDGIIWCLEEDKLYYNDNLILEEYCNITQCLNDDVEIIEEEQENKKMKRLLWCNVEGYSKKAQLLELKENLTLQFIKINEIIDKINKE